jgi:hypothetical protein
MSERVSHRTMAAHITSAEGRSSPQGGTRNSASRRLERLDMPPVDIGFDVVHSEENIRCWMEYLPQDCIETMIRLGWDCTT